MAYNQELWEQVMALEPAGRDEATSVANKLSQDDMQAICGTIDYFGGPWQQAMLDLGEGNNFINPRYRVFDFLAMCIQGRLGDTGKEATKVLVYSFIKVGGVPSKWVEDLQTTDYDIDHSWEKIEI